MTNCMKLPTTHDDSLFRNTGWSFLVDAVRVRPFHEEMTTSLLEEVEKLHSITRKPPGFADTVLAATASISTTASDAPAATASSTTPVGTRDNRSANTATGTGINPSKPTLGGERVTGAVAAAPADERSHGSNSSGRKEEVDIVVQPGGRESSGSSTADDDRSNPFKDGGAVVGTVQGQAEAAAVEKRRRDSEHRRAVLATIDKRTSHHHRHHASATTVSAAAASSAATVASAATAAEGAMGAAQEGLEKRPRAATASGTTRAASCSRYAAKVRVSPRMCSAFSTHSVRSGRTLGYYGREEVDVLSAISKNPSRIAAYNRITEGKTGKNGEKPCSEVG